MAAASRDRWSRARAAIRPASERAAAGDDVHPDPVGGVLGLLAGPFLLERRDLGLTFGASHAPPEPARLGGRTLVGPGRRFRA